MGNTQTSNQNDDKKQDINTADSEQPQSTQSTKPIDINALPEYSMDDVAKHDTKQKGIWIVIEDLVYDVTPFLPFHPGGAGFLLEVAGEDATSEFQAAIHSQSARIKANQYLIGKLKKDKTKPTSLAMPNSTINAQNVINVNFLSLYLISKAL